MAVAAAQVETEMPLECEGELSEGALAALARLLVDAAEHGAAREKESHNGGGA